MKEQKSFFKSIMLKILIAIIVVILVAYLIYNTATLVMSPTNTFVVEEGVLSSEEIVDAYVIRNETVLQGNNYMNGMEKVIVEGNRVAKGEPVFRYYVNGEDTIKNEIAELDKQIAEATEAQNPEDTIYNTDIQTLKDRIRELEEKIYTTNSVEEINNYKKEIDDYMRKISTIVGESSATGTYLKELINQKNECLNKLTNGAEEIISNESGTVSYRVDNLEEIFTVGDFTYLTTEFLDGVNLRTGELIETSDQKGKIITEFNCYLAVVMNSDTAMNAEIGDDVKIALDLENTVEAEIVHINQEEEARVLVFKVNDLPEKLINYRKLSVSVIWWQESGLKVPKSALIEEDGKYFLERTRSGYTAKVLVKVLNQNDSYAIVKNYETQELQDLGYSYSEIRNMYTIKQYDTIKIQN